MRCPKCHSETSSVVETRSETEQIRRRRECDRCQFRFTTYERIEYSLPMVVKKDGRREAFASYKIRNGLLKACEKTPVSVELIDKAVAKIEARIAEQFLKEIPARQLGEYVMEALKSLDMIAYVRFASVYREFRDVSQFVDTLSSLKNKVESKLKTKANHSKISGKVNKTNKFRQIDKKLSRAKSKTKSSS